MNKNLSSPPRVATLVRRLDVDVPATEAWAVIADYRRDPQWRAGVRTMQPVPDGPVTATTTTTEVLRFAGRTYRIPGRVTDLRADGPERSIVWEATKAHGRRAVIATGERSCRVELDLHLHIGPSERLMAPLLVRLMRRRLDGDVTRLAALLGQTSTSSNVTAAASPSGSPAADAAPRRKASGSVGSLSASR